MQQATCLMSNGRKTLRRVTTRWKFGSIERRNSQCQCRLSLDRSIFGRRQQAWFEK